MIVRSFCLLALFLFSGTFVFPQNEPCLQPNSYVLKEIVLGDQPNLSAELDLARKEIDEKAPEQATVVVFGGKRSKVNEVPNLIDKIEKQLRIIKTDYQRRYFVTDGGFRSQASLVFVVRPLKCSDYAIPLPDFNYDEVEFEGFDKENTVVSSSSELWFAASEKARLQCPPAARAVRACLSDTEAEVFILVDRDGNVVFARTVGGHPLIRAAAQASVKRWKMKPLKIGERLMNRSGVVRVLFEEGPAITSND